MTGEYGTGMIRTSLVATPRPRVLFTAKAGVLPQVHATDPEPRLPSLGVAYDDLALYVVVALAAGFWRARRDP